jgi:Fe2+ transport system protein B
MATRNIETINNHTITPTFARLCNYYRVSDSGYVCLGILQGLTLMLLYLIGFAMAIFSAYILNIILKIKCKTSFFVVEMPSYKLPLFKNVALNVIEKKAFVLVQEK